MLLLITTFISLAFILVFGKIIRKYSLPFYAAALIGGIACLFVQMNPVTHFILGGTIPAALYILVMYARVMPDGSFIYKRLMSTRAQMGITASLLLIPHIIQDGGRYLQQAVSGNAFSSVSSAAPVIIAAALIILMVLLTVTSFKKVHSSMGARKWKQLQRWSYLFYALIFAHLAAVNMMAIQSGNASKLANVTVYAGIFATYTLLRLLKHFAAAESRKKLMAVTAAVCLVVCAGFYSGFAMAAGSASADSTVGAVSEHTLQQQASAGVEQSESETTAASSADMSSTEAASTDAAATDAAAAVASMDESASSEMPAVETTGQYKDGTYTGSADGFRSTIEVSVTISGGMITDVEVTQENDTPQFFQRAQSVIDSIINAQSADVSTISGATYSSTGIINAVKEALLQAE